MFVDSIVLFSVHKVLYAKIPVAKTVHTSHFECMMYKVINQEFCHAMLLPPVVSVPSKPKKNDTFGTFFGRQPTTFKKSALAFLDAVSFTGENFTTNYSKILSKMYGTYFTIEAVLRTQHAENSDAFWEFSACKVYEEVLGAFSWFLRLKSKLFAMKFWCIFWVIRHKSLQKCFGRIIEVFTLQVKKKFWAHFLDYCVQKHSCLLWSSDAFWKFFACKVYKKKLWAQCHDICVEKRRYFLWSSDTSWKFSPCKVYTKSSGSIFWTFASKNEAVCREVQTQFWRFRLTCFK